MELCLTGNKGHQSARFLGSATSGLGFYYVETPDVTEEFMVDFSNCGRAIVAECTLTLVTSQRKSWCGSWLPVSTPTGPGRMATR